MAGKHRREKITKKIRKVMGQCKNCLKDKHHFGRKVRGCNCGCTNVTE